MDARERDLTLERAWPPREEHPIASWRARLDAGVTRRANSVLPHGEGAPPSPSELDSWLDTARRLYSTRRLVPWVQVTDAAWPPHLREVLATRGWVTEIDPTVVAEGPLPRTSSGEWDVEVDRAPSEGWLETWWTVDRGGTVRDRAAAAAILTRIESPAAFVSVRAGDGSCVGTALGVLVEDVLVLECVTARPAVRRRGAASAAIGALAGWAAERRVHRSLLSVQADNGPGRALYTGLGLTEVGGYSYARPTL